MIVNHHHDHQNSISLPKQKDFDGEPHDLYDFETKSLLPTHVLEITTEDDAFNASGTKIYINHAKCETRYQFP
jgi:hypothetical protein